MNSEAHRRKNTPCGNCTYFHFLRCDEYVDLNSYELQGVDYIQKGPGVYF